MKRHDGNWSLPSVDDAVAIGEDIWHGVSDTWNDLFGDDEEEQPEVAVDSANTEENGDEQAKQPDDNETINDPDADLIPTAEDKEAAKEELENPQAKHMGEKTFEEKTFERFEYQNKINKNAKPGGYLRIDGQKYFWKKTSRGKAFFRESDDKISYTFIDGVIVKHDYSIPGVKDKRDVFTVTDNWKFGWPNLINNEWKLVKGETDEKTKQMVRRLRAKHKSVLAKNLQKIIDEQDEDTTKETDYRPTNSNQSTSNQQYSGPYGKIGSLSSKEESGKYGGMAVTWERPSFVAKNAKSCATKPKPSIICKNYLLVAKQIKSGEVVTIKDQWGEERLLNVKNNKIICNISDTGGGCSFGQYQYETRRGTFKTFLLKLKNKAKTDSNYAKYWDMLSQGKSIEEINGLAGFDPKYYKNKKITNPNIPMASYDLVKAWQEAANDFAFNDFIHNSIGQMHYQQTMDWTRSNAIPDIDKSILLQGKCPKYPVLNVQAFPYRQYGDYKQGT